MENQQKRKLSNFERLFRESKPKPPPFLGRYVLSEEETKMFIDFVVDLYYNIPIDLNRGYNEEERKILKVIRRNSHCDHIDDGKTVFLKDILKDNEPSELKEKEKMGIFDVNKVPFEKVFDVMQLTEYRYRSMTRKQMEMTEHISSSSETEEQVIQDNSYYRQSIFDLFHQSQQQENENDQLIHLNQLEMKRTKEKEQKERAAAAKCKTISYEAEQESVSIGLLMRHGIRVVLLKPWKSKGKSEKSLKANFLTIDKIIVEGKEFHFSEIIRKEQEEGEKLYSQRGNEKFRKSYEKRNFIGSTNNVLIKMLEVIGYCVVTKKSSERSVVVKMDKLISLRGNGIEINAKEKISDYGIRLNTKWRDIFDCSVDKRESPFEFGYEHINDIFPLGENCGTELLNWIEQKIRN